MLLLLFRFLKEVWGWEVPTLFEYCSTRMACAAIFSLLFTIFFGKFFIRKLYEWKIGDRVRKEDCPLLGELHSKKNDTPTMGGVIILCALLSSLLLWMDLQCSFTLVLFATILCIGMLGFFDDYSKFTSKSVKGLSGKQKLLFQGIFSSFVSVYLLSSPVNESLHFGQWFSPPTAKEVRKLNNGEKKLSSLAVLSTKEYATRLYLPFMKHSLFECKGIALVGMALFFCFVIVGTSNTVNLTDGLDGLATGTVMLAASAFAIIAFLSNHLDVARYLNILYIEGAGEIAVFLSAVVGACLGFLWYNGYPAQVFMGDTGSLTLGALLGVSAVLLKREILLVLIGGVFVIEGVSVILQVGSYRLRNKKRIFLCAPIHHHFEYKGWHETKVVLRFWILGLLLAIVGVATLKFQ